MSGLIRIGGTLRPGIVIEFDKDTSGLLVACKNDFTHRALSRAFANKQVTRKYHALVHGLIDHNFVGLMLRLVAIPKPKINDGCRRRKRRVTNFQVLERFLEHTYLELARNRENTPNPCPFKIYRLSGCGDPQYGLRRDKSPYGQFYTLRHSGLFILAQKYLEWSAPLPNYFQEYLNNLRR